MKNVILLTFFIFKSKYTLKYAMEHIYSFMSYIINK